MDLRNESVIKFLKTDEKYLIFTDKDYYMDWLCHVCQKEATGVIVVPREIKYDHERHFYVGQYAVSGRIRVHGDAEYIPFCKDHDAGDPTKFALRCDLVDFKKLLEKFPVDEVTKNRSIELEK